MSITPHIQEPTFAARLWQSLRGKGFAAGVMMLAGGTALAHVITVIASPILTRLYSPEDFGVLAVFVALFAPLLAVASGRYEQAIPLPREEREAADLLALSVIVAALASLLAAGCLWLAGAPLARLLGVPGLDAYLWLLPPAVLGGAVYAALGTWTMRRKAYRRVAATRFSQSLLRAAAQCLLGWWNWHPWGLLAGEALGQMGGSATLAAASWREDAAALRGVSWSGMGRAAVEHARFPLVTVPTTLLSTMGFMLPCLLLPPLFGAAPAGLFLMSMRLAGWPAGWIGAAVSQVLYNEAAHDGEDAVRTRRRFWRITLHLSIPAVAGAILMLAAPLWAEWLLGANWREAGWVLAALSPVLVGRLIVSPLIPLYNVYGRQHVHLAIEVVRGVLVIGTLVGGAVAGWGLVPTVAAFSLAMMALHAAHWWILWRLLARLTGPVK
jgi:O-antigen/teichoic acid export membrane protein